MPMHFIRSNNIGVSKFCQHTYIVKYVLLSISFFIVFVNIQKIDLFNVNFVFHVKRQEKKEEEGREPPFLLFIMQGVVSNLAVNYSLNHLT